MEKKIPRQKVEGLASGPFHPKQGFAFIKVDSLDDDVFLHFRKLCKQSDKDRLKKGSVVSFDLTETEKGYAAENAWIKADPSLSEPRSGVVSAWPWNYGYVSICGSKPLHSHHTVLEGADYLRPGDVVDIQLDSEGEVARIVPKNEWKRSGLSPYEEDLDMGDPTHWIKDLADLSPERWDVRDKPESGILRQYIKFTYLRQKELPDHLLVHDDTMCWNTGLMDGSGDDILAMYRDSLDSEAGPKWKFTRFLTVADRVATHFRDAPRARYWDDPADLIYDTDKGEPAVQSEHIGEKVDDRFPKYMENYSQQDLIRAVQEAARDAVKRVVQNYKTAIPQYYRPQAGRGYGGIQLLLPLRFPGDESPSLALAVKKDGDSYYASTVLKIEWAYTYARLLTKPDTEWLNPFND